MRVLVCGSRDWQDHRVVKERLEALPPDALVIHGAARGADEMAGHYALALGLAVQEFPADWRLHGRAAGYVRNLAMLDEEPDLVLAFQRDGSRGTQHTIDEARRRRIQVEVVRS